MVVKSLAFTAVAAALLMVAGCGGKSEQYYAEHPSEATDALKKCTAMGPSGLSDQNCINAMNGYARYTRDNADKQAAARKASLKQWRDAADAQMNKNEASALLPPYIFPAILEFQLVA